MAYSYFGKGVEKVEKLSKVLETLKLIWLNLLVEGRKLIEYFRVIFSYYGHLKFAKVDTLLLLSYFALNPFTISKWYHMRKGEKELYDYGETPLTTLAHICKYAEVTDQDRVFELGCGRGRTCYWLRYILGCEKTVGIEIIPEFVQRAQLVQRKCEVDRIEFRNEDMLKSNYSDASVIYFYGTSFDEEFIYKLVKKFKELPKGTKVITVSYPLTDYADDSTFELMSRFPAQFVWGIGDVYVQIKT